MDDANVDFAKNDTYAFGRALIGTPGLYTHELELNRYYRRLLGATTKKSCVCLSHSFGGWYYAKNEMGVYTAKAGSEIDWGYIKTANKIHTSMYCSTLYIAILTDDVNRAKFAAYQMYLAFNINMAQSYGYIVQPSILSVRTSKPYLIDIDRTESF